MRERVSAGLFPVFLKLEGRVCVVIGGGGIGARKAEELVAAGARVRAVSPTFHPLWDTILAERHVRPFAPGDCQGAALVFAATGVPEVDVAIEADARAWGVWLNVVDVPDRCDFYSGAAVRRGPLTVAISTSGASPALARKVRERIEAVLPEPIGVLALALGEARPQLLMRYPDITARAQVLGAFVSDALLRLDRFACIEDARAAVHEALLS